MVDMATFRPSPLTIIALAFFFFSPITSAQRRVAIVSDIHIGDNSPTCWYQKTVHERYLLAMLDWVIQQKDTVDELVLAGDVFDTWTYPFNVQPPTVPQVIAANPNVFNKLGQVIDALDGYVTYMTGNHDIQTTEADLASIVSPSGRRIRYRQNNYNPLGDARLLVGHGHNYCLFNAPDPTASLPVGHFVTRMIADYWQRNLKPGETVAGKPGQGAPNGVDASSIISGALARADVSLTVALLDGIKGKTGISDTDPIKLFDGTTTTLAAVKTKYANLFSTWIAKYGGGKDGLLFASKAALADYDASFMGWFAQRQAFQSGAQLVVFGHTHTPISGLTASFTNYLNTGFACPATPDMPARRVTFITVTLPAAADAPLTGTIYQVVKLFLPFGMRLFFITATSAGTTAVVEGPFMDFSSYAEIDNSQNAQSLFLSRTLVTGGHFIYVPTSIPANGKARVWVQDYPGASGSAAVAVYRDGSGRDVAFNLECPTGVYPNSVSGGSSFQARSATPSSTWPPAGQVPSSGHPLFVKFSVLPGIVQGSFTGAAGQNSYATSQGGLQPLQTATINGATDLSNIVRANDGGRVYSFWLSKVSGIYTYQVSVDAQGPSGLFSGSMYLYFTDQSGDRYSLSVWLSSRKVHTVQYNSRAPAIVKVQWSNTAL